MRPKYRGLKGHSLEGRWRRASGMRNLPKGHTYNPRHKKPSFAIEEQRCETFFTKLHHEQGCARGIGFSRNCKNMILHLASNISPHVHGPALVYARGFHIRSPREHSATRHDGWRF